MSTDPRIQQAVQLIKAGDKAQARPITDALVNEHPDVANLWYLAAMAAADQHEMVRLLNRALQIEPGHVKAKQALDRLGVPLAPTASTPPIPAPQQPHPISQPAAPTAAPADYNTYKALRRQIEKAERTAQSGYPAIYVILGLLGVLLALGSLTGGYGADGRTLALTIGVPAAVLVVIGFVLGSRKRTAKADLPQLYTRATALDNAPTSYGFKDRFAKEGTSRSVLEGCVGLLLFCGFAAYLLVTWVGRANTSNSPSSAPSTGNWVLTTEKSPIDDKTTYTLSVVANERIEGVYQSSVLVVCQKGEVVTGMKFETPLDLISAITLRFDQGFTSGYQIHTSDNGRVLIFDDTDRAFKNLTTHDLLAVRVKTLLYDERDITFDIRGLSSAAVAVESKCR